MTKFNGLYCLIGIEYNLALGDSLIFLHLGSSPDAVIFLGLLKLYYIKLIN